MLRGATTRFYPGAVIDVEPDEMKALSNASQILPNLIRVYILTRKYPNIAVAPENVRDYREMSNSYACCKICEQRFYPDMVTSSSAPFNDLEDFAKNHIHKDYEFVKACKRALAEQALSEENGV